MREERIRKLGYALAAAFAAVGLVFLLIPGRMIGFFNRISARWELPPAPPAEAGLFVLLGVAYMIVVTALAWNMGRHPGDLVYARLLALAKISSSLLSLGFVVFKAPYFVILVNGLVDGLIGQAILWLVLSPGGKHEAGP